MYQLLPRFQTKEAARIDFLARKFQKLAEGVCKFRTELKPDDVIKAAQDYAGKWALDIETYLIMAEARAELGLKLPWEV